LLIAVLVAGYALVLGALYEYIISPRFAYLEFTSVHPDPLYVLLDALLCGALALCLPQQVSKPSDLGRVVVFFVIAIPSVVIPTFLGERIAGTVLETKVYGAVAFLVLSGVLVVLPRDVLPKLRLPGDMGLYVLVAISAAAVVALGSSYGFSIQLHSLTDVYDQREIYSEGGGGTGIVGLATGLLQNALAPIFLVVGMYRRSTRWFMLGAVLLLYVYSITGVKSALIGMMFVIGIYTLARMTTAATFTRAWSIATIVFVAAAGIAATLPFISVAIDLIVRRILIMQGMLNYNYIEVFGSDEPTYFSHTIFGAFFERPFEGIPPEIVGGILFGRSVHANASFVADGYVSGKLLGVILAALLIAAFMALLDGLCTGFARPIALACTCMALYITTQSGLVTALLNHGGIALAGCLWLAGSAFTSSGFDNETSRSRRVSQGSA
jgi:hypothetical protein